ncbi:type I secretion system permease/ATPase [Brevundimonas sp. VNH65]|uniref:type I secretion system permease/ATPase n=1 Tax=Brevundimonas sp. VNH65 TaxID=3400917 RepID=UPI003C01BB8A
MGRRALNHGVEQTHDLTSRSDHFLGLGHDGAAFSVAISRRKREFKAQLSPSLLHAINLSRPYLIWAGAFSALVNVLYLAPTLYMMQVYDRVVPTGGLTTLALLSATTLFALATLAALDWLRVRILQRLGLRLDRALSAEILGRVIQLRSASSSAQVMREFDGVRGALSGSGALAVMDAPWTPLYVACTFLLHPAIGFLTLTGGALLFGLAWINERDSRSRLLQGATLGNAAYASQQEIGSQAEVARALGMRRATVARQVAQRREAIDQQVRAQLAGGRFSSLIKFSRLGLQSAALGLAAYLVVKGQVSAGAIIASSVLLSRAVAPIEQLVAAWPSITQARTSWRALVDLFAHTEDAQRTRTRLPDPEGRVAVENISVRLTGEQAPQLAGVRFRLEPGQVLGIVGASGSGKTTLARLLVGALVPDAGSLRLDGAEYEAWEADDLARHIGYLPQSPSLFEGSIRENISRFQAFDGVVIEALDEQVISAAKAAGAHDLILRLPEGYDTRLGPQGAGISVGQGQRIALARALYGNPILLVLDEPNANLDMEGEAALMAAVAQAAARGAAVVIIAHRAGVLARVDRLLMLRDGSMQMEGPREDVLTKLRASRSGPPLSDGGARTQAVS